MQNRFQHPKLETDRNKLEKWKIIQQKRIKFFTLVFLLKIISLFFRFSALVNDFSQQIQMQFIVHML